MTLFNDNQTCKGVLSDVLLVPSSGTAKCRYPALKQQGIGLQDSLSKVIWFCKLEGILNKVTQPLYITCAIHTFRDAFHLMSLKMLYHLLPLFCIDREHKMV